MSVPERPRELVAARLATAGIFLANGFGIGAWAAAIPALKARHGLGEGALSLALLAVALGAIALMPLSTLLVRRLGGTDRLTRLGALAFAGALALPGWAEGLWTLCGAALLFGASNGVTDVAMNAHASTLEKRWGAAIMSSFHAAFSCGGLLGAATGGALLHFGVPVRWLLTLPAGAVLLIVLGAAPRLGPSDSGAEAGPHLSLPQRRVLLLCLIGLGCLLLEGAMGDWSGVYLSSVSRASTALAAGGYAGFSLTMVAGRLLGDRIVGRIGGPRTIRYGTLAAAAGLLVAVVLPAPQTAIPGFALVGLGLSNVVPAVFSASGRATATPAEGIAMAATSGYLGFLIGPPLIGAVAARLGLQLALGGLAGVGLVCSLLAARLSRRAETGA
ncbi:MAG: MFS transporter [Polyangia bacterium]